MTIERYLTEHQQGTPRQIFRLLRQGRVTVNERVVDSPLLKLAEADQVASDGLAVSGRDPQYLLFNKPTGMMASFAPDAQPGLGSLLNTLDRSRALESLADLPRDWAGLVLASDDQPFLADVASQAWASRLQVQLKGQVAVTAVQDWQRVTRDYDQLRDVTTLTGWTTASLADLPSLADQVGPTIRLGFGPLSLSIDLAVGTYRGLFDSETEDLEKQLELADESPAED